MSAYDFTVKGRDGSDVSLDQYKGDVALIVNTATGCGFTPQYEDLEALYKDHKDEGFVILDFPCNQFGHQAPGTAEEIHEFCTLKFGADFPQFAKVEVLGDEKSPLFEYLIEEAPFKGMKDEKMAAFFRQNDPNFDKTDDVKWNFTKFLINPEGEVIARFEPTDSMDEVRKAVEEQLKAKAA